MNGFNKYSEIFINRAKQLLDEEDLKNNLEYHEVFKNQILGLSGPKQLTRKQTPSEIFFSKLCIGFREIWDSYYCLLDIETYLGRFPYGNTKISKTRYLAYHMENYLNEIYILKLRLNRSLRDKPIFDSWGRKGAEQRSKKPYKSREFRKAIRKRDQNIVPRNSNNSLTLQHRGVNIMVSCLLG